MKVSITRRGLQITLGLIWLLDGLLQFQSFMYSHGFLKEVIEPSAEMQPAWIGHPILAAAHFAGQHLTLWNTLFALVQCLIGLGLLYRPTVKPALRASFAWTFVVWWFGEGFGMVLANMGSPLTGAPGAVLLYGLIGLMLWPTARENGRSVADRGPIGDRGGLLIWSALWLSATVLWCLASSRPPDAISGALTEGASNSMHWLASLQISLAHTTHGQGRVIAIVLATLSLAIAAGVWTRWRRETLTIGALLSIVYWLLGQSLGALTTGTATDPNIGPLFVLLALALWPRPQLAARRLDDRRGRQAQPATIASASMTSSRG
jgi:hypothetical protein